ncbi:tubulin folding cofactor A, partial [Halocaridina rubra]
SQHQGNAPPPTPSQITGTSTSFELEERGDLILFYNQVYVQKMKAFALKFRTAQEGDPPPLSPSPVVRHTPVSPRRRISSNHAVYVNSLCSPMKGNTAMSPRRPLPYYFNRSPAKDLRVINRMLKMKGAGKRPLLESENGSQDIKRSLLGAGISRRIQDVMGDSMSATATQELQQHDESSLTQDESSLPQNGHATLPSSEDNNDASDQT